MPHPVEEGSGAPSFRPLWSLMPYLWPKDIGLRLRVVVSLLCLVLGILATTYFPILMGQVTNQLAQKPAAKLAIGTTMALTGGALARLHAITPPGHTAKIDLSITDDFPLAQAIVIISAVPEA